MNNFIIATQLSLDHDIASFMNKLLNNFGSFLTPILKFITILGNFGTIFIILSLLFLLFTKTRKAGIIALIALLIGVITVSITKIAVSRDRPFFDTNSDFYSWWLQAGAVKESSYSFPSGHTTAATEFGVALFISKNKKYSWLFLFIPLIMGFTRIYFIVHYFTDICGGLIIGTISATISYFIAKNLLKIKLLNKAYYLPSIIDIFSKKEKEQI